MADTDFIAATPATGDALRQRLLTRGWEFDFFQAVWLLDGMLGDKQPVGERGPVAEEAIQFRPDVSLGFPATDIRRIFQRNDAGSDRSPYCVEVTFLGLYGVSSPLPVHYAVDILRAVDKAGTLSTPSAEYDGIPGAADATPAPTPTRDFLDIFHHRLISFFYRAWLKYRFYRSYSLPHRDVITKYLLWFIGVEPNATADELGLPPDRLLRYAGALTQRPKCAQLLEGIISDYWHGLSVTVHQAVGRWVTVSGADMNSLGRARCGLGTDLTIGEQVYDLSGLFSISIGPLDWETYQLFLPGQPCFCETRAIVRLYCDDPLAFTIELELRADQVPELQLTSGSSAGRLGFTSWVRTEEMPETSVIFDSNARVALPEPIDSPENSGDREKTFRSATT